MAETDGELPRRPLLSRLPWLPLALSLAVVLSSGFAVRPVRDAATLSDVTEAYLARPVGYVALGPVSAIFDTVVLLSARQHIALLLGLLVLFVAQRVVRHLHRGSTWRGHLGALALFLAAFAVIYAGAVLLPRPMAYLASQDANVMRIDFHSHTSASRDARRAFTPQRNRDWHRAAGYDVAYVTDHASVAGAERGMAGNTVSGLDHPVLLQAIEATWTGEHVAILGAQRTYTGLLTENLRDVDARALELASVLATREPVVVWHHPRDLSRLPPAAGPATAGIRAIEISNGSPDNMDDVRPKRAAIRAFAERHDLTLTTGSDNHGWGYTAPNWTLMRPPGWRGLTGDQLALRIERVIREGGFLATRTVERTVADYGANVAALAFTVVTVPATMLRTLSADERVMWLVWIWGIWGLTLWARRRRVRG